MAAKLLKDLGLLNPSRTAFFMCDIQEKFRPAMLYFDEVVSVAKKMVSILSSTLLYFTFFL